MQQRRLGRTDHESSVAILGGAAFWDASAEEAERGLRLALDAGVNHLDIAPRYGKAEEVVGPYVQGVRDRLFVACKTTRRNADGVRAQLDESLTKLGTDSFDLYQMHGVTTLEELDDRAAAAEVILAARDEGVTKFAGITGHDMQAPVVFREALRRYDLDTVMFPVYPRLWGDADYRAAAEELLAVCEARDVGVMAIKAVARRPWGDGDRFATSWYEPHADQASIDRGVRFALSTGGVHAFCTPGDLKILPLALDAAERFTPMSEEERADAVEAMAPEALIFPMFG
jgi:aryl-alcohol dehydrogenase-like predicted oxidoreductase